MTTTRIVILLILISLLILMPNKVNGGDMQAEVKQVSVTVEPFELIQIPAKLKEKYKDNYLLVHNEFKDTPKMLDVVMCESGFVQFKDDGTTLRSPTSDVGIMQINQVNWSHAKELGLDVFNSVEDNIAMGRVILTEQGVGAWVCSK